MANLEREIAKLTASVSKIAQDVAYAIRNISSLDSAITRANSNIASASSGIARLQESKLDNSSGAVTAKHILSGSRVDSLAADTIWLRDKANHFAAYPTVEKALAALGSGLLSVTSPHVPYASAAGVLSDTAMHWDSGKLGIGTASPEQLLHVEKNSDGSTRILVKNTSNTALASSVMSVQAMSSAGLYSSFLEAVAENNSDEVDPADRGAGFVGASGSKGFAIRSDHASGIIRFKTGGVAASNERMRITADGKVGIGTTSPLTNFEVYGNQPEIKIRDDGSVNRGLYLQQASTLVSYIFNQDNAALALGTNNIERMQIGAGGGVGIGTKSPSYPLDLQAAQSEMQIKSTTSTNRADLLIVGGQTAVFGVESSAGGSLLNTGSLAYATVLGCTGNYALQFGTNNAVNMTILSGGNVGIGTTSPLTNFEVYGNQPEIKIRDDGSVNRGLYLQQASTLVSYIFNQDNADLALGTNNIERMRITNGGNVGIGTTSPNALLDVRGSAVFNEAGADVDFRIEGDTVANLFCVDASTDRIGIGTAGPGAKFSVWQDHANVSTIKTIAELYEYSSGTAGNGIGLAIDALLSSANGLGGSIGQYGGHWLSISAGQTAAWSETGIWCTQGYSPYTTSPLIAFSSQTGEMAIKLGPNQRHRKYYKSGLALTNATATTFLTITDTNGSYSGNYIVHVKAMIINGGGSGASDTATGLYTIDFAYASVYGTTRDISSGTIVGGPVGGLAETDPAGRTISGTPVFSSSSSDYTTEYKLAVTAGGGMSASLYMSYEVEFIWQGFNDVAPTVVL